MLWESSLADCYGLWTKGKEINLKKCLNNNYNQNLNLFIQFLTSELQL